MKNTLFILLILLISCVESKKRVYLENKCGSRKANRVGELKIN